MPIFSHNKVTRAVREQIMDVITSLLRSALVLGLPLFGILSFHGYAQSNFEVVIMVISQLTLSYLFHTALEVLRSKRLRTVATRLDMGFVANTHWRPNFSMNPSDPEPFPPIPVNRTTRKVTNVFVSEGEPVIYDCKQVVIKSRDATIHSYITVFRFAGKADGNSKTVRDSKFCVEARHSYTLYYRRWYIRWGRIRVGKIKKEYLMLKQFHETLISSQST